MDDDHFLYIYGRYKSILYRFLLIIIVVLMLVISISPVHGEKTKTVKIGYFYAKNYQEGKSDSDAKSGLGYEYIQQVANYAGWKCQYVYGTWQEIYQKLLKGEVDVMSDISYSKQRRKHMLFSTIPFARENYYLYVPKSKVGQYENLKSLKGKSVGVTKGLIQTKQLEVWNKKHKANLVLKYYDSSAQRIKAYGKGQTDITLAVSLNTMLKENNVPLRYIGSSNTYIVTSKKRSDLLEDINQAVATLTSTVPRIDSSLAEKYSANSIVMSELSVRQLTWFKKHPTIDIGYLDDMAPFSYTNDNGKAAGTYVDLLKYTFKRFRLDNKLRYHAYKNVSVMLKDLKNKKIDIFVPYIGNAWCSEKMGILQSINMNSTAVSLIQRRAKVNHHILATTEQTPIKDVYLQKYLKDYKTVSYKSIDDCLKAVRLGEADATILNAYQVSIYVHSDDNFSEKRLSKPLEMTLAIGSENKYLLDLVNRGIVIWTQQNISESLMRHTDTVQVITVGDFIKKHYIGVMAFIALLVASFTIPITGWIYTKRRRMLAEKAANNDLLTGLYSRRAYDQYLDHSMSQSKDFAVIAMDVNGLKNVNDHLGHQAGDEMLVGVASCIKETMHHFNSEGKAYRTGGDEFIIILAHHKDFDAFYQDLLSRIASWHGQLVDHITVSSGYAFASDYPASSIREIVSYADEEMYLEKGRKKDLEHYLSREDYDIYKRLLQMYEADLDPLTQLPGSIYFYYSEPHIRKEVEDRDTRLVILAITITPVSADISNCLIRMFGKENLSRFDDYYYVMTSEVSLTERINDLYHKVSSLSKSTAPSMSVGIYVIDHDDQTPIKEICKNAREKVKIYHDQQLHINN